MKKRALLLVNIGTPDKPRRREVRKYLCEFLNDRRVIDIPWLLQKILVNFIIIPFRVRKSTRLYQRMWTVEGSPLQVYLQSLSGKLQVKLEGKYTVYPAMRYGNPSLSSVLNIIKSTRVDEITVLPLFPQYASSTTGSIFERISGELRKWDAIPGIRFIEQYYHHPSFIRAYSSRIAEFSPLRFSHIVFSYHGLPLRHLNRIHPHVDCSSCTCEHEMPDHGRLCYKAACYETTRLLVKKLRLPASRISVGFQSRLSKNWLSPFTDELIISLAANGEKKLLIVAPSFVADCLETLVEIEQDYKALFLEKGGEELRLVTSLNDSDEWIDAAAEMVLHG